MRPAFSKGAEAASRKKSVLTAAFALCALVSASAYPAGYLDTLGEIHPGKGVTSVVPLSSFFGPLEGSAFDTPVYILKGASPGAVVLVVGGTHENEIAGSLAAIYLIEHCQADSGTLVVVPRANASAAGWTEGESSIKLLSLPISDTSTRLFRSGSRLSNPADEPEPDPAVFLPPYSPPGGIPLPGRERRNLDREYPGAPDGCMTSRLAYAILRLIELAKVDIAFDLHEASLKSGLARSIIANPKNVEPAAIAALSMEDMGLRFKLDQSSPANAGYSHREWGDRTSAMAFLVETFNPDQGDNGAPTDRAKVSASPLRFRVAEQLAAVAAILGACADELGPSKPFSLSGFPSFSGPESAWISEY